MKIEKKQLEKIKKTILQTFKDIKREAKKNRKCLRKACGCAILIFYYDESLTDIPYKNRTIYTLNITPIIVTAINGPSGKQNKCSGIKGSCGCSHAEPRVIMSYLKSKESLKYFSEDFSNLKTILLTTFSSCVNCANIIIDSEVVNAVSYEFIAPHWAKDPNNAKKMLDENLIHFSKQELIKDKSNKILKKILNISQIIINRKKSFYDEKGYEYG